MGGQQNAQLRGGHRNVYRGWNTETYRGGGGQEKHKVGGHRNTQGGTIETQKCDGHTDRHTHTHAERCT